MHNLLDELQKEIVNYSNGHVMISGGPGTGKTHTLIERIIHTFSILETHGHILVFTFTQQHADELLHRLRAESLRLDCITMCTMNQFCLDFLYRYAEDSPLPKNFTLADEKVIKDIVKDIWPQKSSQQRTDILEEISFVKSTELALHASSELIAYQKALRAKSLIDSDDLTRETLMLLENNEEFVRSLGKKYRHIFIDEYQDINCVQHALLKILAKEGVYVTAAGDANQAIYGYRGCDVAYIHRFADDFSNATIFMLHKNYRSGISIVETSSQVIKHITSTHLHIEAEKVNNPGKITIHEATTDRSEAEYIAHTIEKLIKGTKNRTPRSSVWMPKDIVVFVRLKEQIKEIVQALEYSGILYQIGNESKITEHNDEIREKITLSTLQYAKGLEFPVVFIAGCEDKIIPLDLPQLKGDIEEECRLFYVGISRAKDELYVTHAKRRRLFDQAYAFEPSPFIKHLKVELKPKTDNQLKLF